MIKNLYFLMEAIKFLFFPNKLIELHHLQLIRYIHMKDLLVVLFLLELIKHLYLMMEKDHFQLLISQKNLNKEKEESYFLKRSMVRVYIIQHFIRFLKVRKNYLNIEL
jgi:hypothetical protein